MRGQLGFGGLGAASREVVFGRTRKLMDLGGSAACCVGRGAGDASGLHLIKNKRELGRWLNPTAPAHVTAGRICTGVRGKSVYRNNKEWKRG